MSDGPDLPSFDAQFPSFGASATGMSNDPNSSSATNGWGTPPNLPRNCATILSPGSFRVLITSDGTSLASNFHDELTLPRSGALFSLADSDHSGPMAQTN